MEDKFKLYDEIVQVAITNLFTLSKVDGTLRLYGFDPKDKAHLAVLAICPALRLINNTEIEIRCGLRGRAAVRAKGFKWKWALKNKDGVMDINDFIAHIEIAYKMPGIMEEIYNAYYANKV